MTKPAVAKKPRKPRAKKAKPAPRTKAKIKPPSPKAKAKAKTRSIRKAVGALKITDVKTDDLSFSRKSSGGSMYEPVLVKVRLLTPGRSVKVAIPKGLSPVDFRVKISAAVRKRLTDEDRPKGLLRTRMVVDPKTQRATHVAVICSA